MTAKIGIADTMFARIDMFKYAKKAVDDSGEDIKIQRYTVPGIKDLPVACKRLLEESNCDIALALGMPGPEEIDRQCAHEASQGLMSVQLTTNKHILEVFVHLDEAGDTGIHSITENRTYEHAMNAIKLLKGPETLSRMAGMGIRQGAKSVGPLKEV